MNNFLQNFTKQKFSVKQQTFFVKRLCFLIQSGLPLIECITLIKTQSKKPGEKKIFEYIHSHISQGQSLANSLEHQSGLFGNFSINLIRAGESSGTLTQNLSYLAEELRKKEVLRKKIMSALLYPCIITIATFGITGLLITYIFPKILPIFQSLHATLPMSTRIVIFISNTIKQYGLYIFIFFILTGICLYFILNKRIDLKLKVHKSLIAIPFFGKIIRDYNIANFSRTLGLLLKSGLSLRESLNLTQDTLQNLECKRIVHHMSDSVLKGKNISTQLEEHHKIFGDITGHMVAVGEKSGNLPATLIYLSEFYENELEDLTKNLSSAIEPVLMVIMGLLVGFVAISVITPIYEITNSLKQ